MAEPRGNLVTPVGFTQPGGLQALITDPIGVLLAAALPGDQMWSLPVIAQGLLTTSSTTANQVIASHTVASGRVLFVCLFVLQVCPATPSTTVSYLGWASLQVPSGTIVVELDAVNPSTGQPSLFVIPFPYPPRATAGQVVRAVCTPATTTSIRWRAAIVGYTLPAGS